MVMAARMAVLTLEKLTDNEYYKEVFKNCDKNEDGTIDEVELFKVMKSLGLWLTNQQLKDMMAMKVNNEQR